jgi:hypothetical protein
MDGIVRISVELSLMSLVVYQVSEKASHKYKYAKYKYKYWVLKRFTMDFTQVLFT